MSFAQDALKNEASTDPSTNALGLFEGAQATNVAGSGLTVAQLMQQAGLVNPQVNQTVAESTLGGQYDEANAYIGQEQLGLQGQGLQAQQGLLNTQYGIQQQTLAGQEQLAGTQYGLSQQALAAQQQQQNLSYGNQQKATQGQIATSGVVGGQGAQNQVSTQAAENQMANQAIQRTGIGEQAQYGFQQQQFGLEQQGQAAQQAYSLGDIARGETGLNLASQQNGLGLDQTINQIGYGMTQAGLQGQQAGDQIQGQIGSAIANGSQYTAGAMSAAALSGSGINMGSTFAGTPAGASS